MEVSHICNPDFNPSPEALTSSASTFFIPATMSQNQRFLLTWGAVSFIFAALFTFNNNSAMVLMASGLLKVVAVLVGTATGTLGAWIGEAIRRYALPDGFFTDGGITSILKTKLFWAIGPQFIGMFLGMSIGAAIVLK